MQAVILAAGRGSRLGNLTDKQPKGMVTLDGRSFIEWQCAAIRKAGISNITVVTGYLGNVISDQGFVTISNPDWNRGNMVSSLACALEHISGPLVVSYSDIVYEAESVCALVEETAPLAVSYDKDWLELWSSRFNDPLSDAETFRLDDERNILEIGQRTNSLADIQGQFMGLLKIEIEARSWIEQILTTEPSARLNFDTTSLLQRLISTGHPLKAVARNGGWCEIDSLTDLAVAKKLISKGNLKFSD